MQNAVYTSLFGALSSEHRLAVISNNLANANTNGYKTDKLAFKDTMIHFAHDYIREPLENLRSKPLFPEAHLLSRVRIAESKTDFTQGPMETTSNQLDVALAGKGFFSVLTPQGEFLTRNGAFSQNADGTLMTKQGYPVLGEGGPIVIPDGTRNVHISDDGRVFADNVEVGAFKITAFADPSLEMEKLGYNLYRVRDGATPETVDAYAEGLVVNQGFLEKANINVVEEMVKMIETQRAFEANSKVMQTGHAMDTEAITKVGKGK